MSLPEKWRRPEIFLILLAAAMPLAYATWNSLLNNFAIERAAFTGKEIGILHSLREIPGFLAFTAIFITAFIREQRFILLSLLIAGFGVVITGQLPTVIGLYFTTVLMSAGFHYYETLQMSLTLQWIDKSKAPLVMGQQISAKSFASLFTFGLVWLLIEVLGLSFENIYIIGGCATMAIALFLWLMFPQYPETHPQHKHIVLRRRYWLFYAMTFMAGARRQIFVVFAGFLLVEKFGMDAATIAMLYLINHVVSLWAAPLIGRLIGHWGERRALIIEYFGLFIVFTGYAFVETAEMAGFLYVVDHIFFAMAIALKSYFQKIADPKDIAATASVSFSINHIAAVVIPALFGLIWLTDASLVFLLGSAMALISLILSLLVPSDPRPGNEATLPKKPTAQPNSQL